MSMGDLTKYAYVRYSEAAVEHLFAVASGLDSAVIGEQQVLGQVRRAYATAEANHTVGRVLHDLAQRALSVGKRVHSETAIDAAGASVVSVALDMRRAARHGRRWPGRTAAVIGAGSMGALSAAHLVRAGVGHVHVVNRSLPRAQRLAENIREQGVGADGLDRSTTCPPRWPTPTSWSAAPARCGRSCRWPTCTTRWRTRSATRPPSRW